MKRKYGEMWQRWHDADLFLVTGNSTCNQNGYLIMGSGSANEAATKFKGITKALGETVSKNEPKQRVLDCVIYKPYYLIVSPRWPQAKLGLFQTREYYGDRSDLFLISAGVEALNEWIPRGREALGRDPMVVMPMPGTGSGGVAVDDVLVYVRALPDCVEVWQNKSQQEISLRPEHRLAPLLDCSYNDYKAAVKELLGHEFDEVFILNNIDANSGPGMNPRERLHRFLLLESYLENGGKSEHAWVASRVKMRHLEQQMEADGY